MNSKTKAGRKHGKVQIRANEKCDVCDPGDKWCTAQIIEVATNHRQIKVHYVGWSDRYDEWLDFESYRIAPLHRYSFMSGVLLVVLTFLFRFCARCRFYGTLCFTMASGYWRRVQCVTAL